MNGPIRSSALDDAEQLPLLGLATGTDSATLVDRIVERAIAERGPDVFDWCAGNPDVVISEQPQTAVYLNPYGAVVVLQEARDGQDDPFVYFQPSNIPALIKRLQQICREVG